MRNDARRAVASVPRAAWAVLRCVCRLIVLPEEEHMPFQETVPSAEQLQVYLRDRKDLKMPPRK